jgi:CspA family cold shock protein
MARLWRMAFAAPAVVIGLYAVVDCVIASFPRSARAERAWKETARPNRRGPVDGTVVAWHDGEGWGVLASPQVDGEVWVHTSNIASTIRRPYLVGLPVRFSFETPGPEGYGHRAVWVTRSP